MRLLRLEIHGFGSLRGAHHFDPHRLTLVVDDNERGKSTLLAALSAALYGLSDDRRAHRAVTPLERWRPWDGGPYGVELELECGGERLTVRRDFGAGTLGVWNGAGQEVTARFLDGKDQYPIGKLLLGLDLEEFEKCSFLRQEDLAEVVPFEEKDRRTNPLQAKLERAADTRAGNSSAAEALRVLEEAATRYTEPLLDTTIKVENAIQRMNAKLLELDTEIHTLQHDFDAIREPLDRLASIDGEERAADARDHALNAERRSGLRAEAQSKLDQHRSAEEERGRLMAEIAETAAWKDVPHDSDARFQEVAARLEELGHQDSRLEAVRKDLETHAASLERDLGELSAFAALGDREADRFVAQAAELRRLEAERTQASEALAQAREALTALGFDGPVIERLTGRFDGITAERRTLLETQPPLALELQSEIAEAEVARDASQRAVDEIGRARRARAVPAWIVAGFGVAAGAAAAVQVAMPFVEAPWEALAAGAFALLGIGVTMWVAAARAGGADHRVARDQLAGAEAKLEDLGIQRQANDRKIHELAQALGCVDASDLVRSFSEFQHLERERQPVARAAQLLGEFEASRDIVLEQAGHPPDAAFLDRAAGGIRTRMAKALQRTDLAGRLEIVRSDLAALRKHKDDLEASARATLKQAGLERDASQPWSSFVPEVNRRTVAARRHAALVGDLLPRVQQAVLHEDIVRHLQQLLEMLAREDAADPASVEAVSGAGARPLLEIERDTAEVRGLLDVLRRERAELRVRVEETSRRYHQHHPERVADREAFERALAKARRFKDAVDLARVTIEEVALETHRRWAEFLNARVGEVLRSVGTEIEHVRFGEDLDFAVKPRRGQPVARGKAVRTLSSGARDQLHMAVRLAIGEYLSREEPLPLLIDDCFSTSDDGRARQGMRLLIEHFARNHQVILVTCHRKRFETLAGEDWDLYQQRVNWIDTQHLRAAGAATPA